MATDNNISVWTDRYADAYHNSSSVQGTHIRVPLVYVLKRFDCIQNSSTPASESKTLITDHD